MAIFQKVDDKAFHVFAGILITALTGFILYRCFNCTAIVSGAVGILSGAGAGLIKELYDKYIKKTAFSVPDLLSTCWGSLVGLIILIVIIANL